MTLCTMCVLALFRLAFASAPRLNRLTLPSKVTRRFIMQKARRHPSYMTGSDRLQADGFRVCFTPLSGVLFTFPSRYWFAIGLSVVFSLAGWSPLIQTGFHVSRPTQDPAKLHNRIRVRDSHPLRPSFQRVPLPTISLSRSPTTPAMPKHRRFGLMRVRSPLLAQSLLFSFPVGT